jgi:hypothetical protein
MTCQKVMADFHTGKPSPRGGHWQTQSEIGKVRSCLEISPPFRRERDCVGPGFACMRGRACHMETLTKCPTILS